MEPRFTVVDLRGLPADEVADRVRELAYAQRVEPFDLSDPLLIRFTLIRADGESKLVITSHHILIDGWSSRWCWRICWPCMGLGRRWWLWVVRVLVISWRGLLVLIVVESLGCVGGVLGEVGGADFGGHGCGGLMGCPEEFDFGLGVDLVARLGCWVGERQVTLSTICRRRGRWCCRG